jgi:hypothetical protein
MATKQRRSRTGSRSSMPSSPTLQARRKMRNEVSVLARRVYSSSGSAMRTQPK